MAKLEEVLKASGFTDEEIAANATILADPKLRGALEGSFGKMETTLDGYKSENERWAKWHETEGKPVLDLYEKERNDARAELAAAKERLKIAEEGGFVPSGVHGREGAGAAAAAAGAGAPAPFDPKAHKLVTTDDIARYADLEGDAIAMMQDLSAEYQQLTGKNLLEYSTADSEGRVMRGARALRQEALKSGKRMDVYVAEKFDFAGKRQAAADAQRKSAEDAIRADERAKVTKEYGDPNLRPLMPSRDPFIPRNGDGKVTHPWENDQTAVQRRSARLERAMNTQMTGGVQ